LLGTAALSACEPSARHTAAPVPSRYAEASWESALQPVPELLVVVRPQALRSDPVYGSLVARAIELAREHTPQVAETGTLGAMEDAEEVIVGVRDRGPDATSDLIVVVRGVRANVDPAALVDEGGRALWAPGPDGPAANVRELVRTRGAGQAGPGTADAPDASLFELPGRTWVIATGTARARARDAFARPSPAGPAAASDLWAPANSAVALVRLSGPALVARLRALRPPGLLAPVGHELSAITVVLPAGEDAVVRATLSYQDGHAVALAETTVREAIAALVAAKSDDYGWLRSATVRGSPCCVVVTTRLPPPHVGGAPETAPVQPPRGPLQGGQAH
jgi:hypothetical protein